MRILLVACLALYCAAAAAQLRSIPAAAKFGSMSHREGLLVELDGKPEMLAPGAQIRDIQSRIVLPASLPKATPVKYLRDPQGQVHRVWILTAEEAKLEDR